MIRFVQREWRRERREHPANRSTPAVRRYVLALCAVAQDREHAIVVTTAPRGSASCRVSCRHRPRRTVLTDARKHIAAGGAGVPRVSVVMRRVALFSIVIRHPHWDSLRRRMWLEGQGNADSTRRRDSFSERTKREREREEGEFQTRDTTRQSERNFTDHRHGRLEGRGK